MHAHRLFIPVVFFSLLAPTMVESYENPPTEPGFSSLFDGKNIEEHFIIKGKKESWTVKDGVIHSLRGGNRIVSKEQYGDFVLRLDWRISDQGNSGIFIRCADPQSVRDTNCYEVNIYDTRADQTYRTGGIVHIAAPTSVINAGGRWNTYEIAAQGPQLTVTLNGTQTVDVEDSQFADGPIALQYGAGIVKFRNVRVRRR